IARPKVNTLTNVLWSDISTPALRRQALLALGSIGGKQALEYIRAGLSTEQMSSDAIDALSLMREDAYDPLLALAGVILSQTATNTRVYDKAIQSYIDLLDASDFSTWPLGKLQNIRALGTEIKLELQRQGLN